MVIKILKQSKKNKMVIKVFKDSVNKHFLFTILFYLPKVKRGLNQPSRSVMVFQLLK